ncbi:hypothetical protein CVS30_08815 [Arthrobacter psychrolactophilus]|uniref:DNA ligase (ATP) n=1 Tax=Arthrobacter psychrolactophilus TaxID=92442 RepID=A0A2V5ITP5_9MICC|nr:hypothetical protein CVS30_08815 [Arthrobacter psychrolactophilus]
MPRRLPSTSPEFVAEGRYTELNKDGELRHPTWRGWRPDKSAQDVRWEY